MFEAMFARTANAKPIMRIDKFTAPKSCFVSE